MYVIINDRRILQYKRIYFIVQSTETSYTIFINLITTIITNEYFLHSNFETGGVTCINHAGYFKFPKPAFSRQAIYRQAIYNQNDFRKIYVLSWHKKGLNNYMICTFIEMLWTIPLTCHFWTFFFKVKLKLISCSTLLRMHAFTLLYIKCELS